MKSIGHAIAAVAKRGGYDAGLGYAEHIAELLEELAGLTETEEGRAALSVLAGELEMGMVALSAANELGQLPKLSEVTVRWPKRGERTCVN